MRDKWTEALLKRFEGREDLGKKGFETIVMQKGKYAILCVGKFNQMNEAKATIAKLKSKYKDCLVRSM